jgi:hypothetical protein
MTTPKLPADDTATEQKPRSEGKPAITRELLESFGFKVPEPPKPVIIGIGGPIRPKPFPEIKTRR